MLQDIRYGLRTLLRARAFTVVVVLSLALGIGANTAIFTVINAVMLRELPVRNPEQLVEGLSRYPGEPRMNFFGRHVLEHFRANSQSFAALSGTSFTREQVTLDGSEAEPVDGERVTGDLFATLGLQPLIGRLIGPNDAAGVAVISWSYWRTRFGADPSILNRRLLVNGESVTIVGVAPREFGGLLVGRPTSMWMPMSPTSPVQLIGRLRAGVSIDDARAELRVLDRFRTEELAARDPQWRKATLDVESAATGFSFLRDRFGNQLRILMATVGLLLLIACTNVASLLAARATSRQREIAVRVALGAGRLRLIRQLLTESLLLSAVAGAIGLALAEFGASTLVQAWPIDSRSRLLQYDIALQPDARVLLFTAALTIATAAVFGLAPAWNAFASAGSPSLRHVGVSTGTRAGRLFGKGLVVGQVTLSVVLLSAALLFIGHVSTLRTRDVGFQADSVLLVRLDAAGSGHSRDQAFRLYRDLLGRLQSIPGVRSVALAAVTPISGGAASRFVQVDGFLEPAEARRRVSLNWVGPQYFTTVGTRLLAGRDFTAGEADGPRVAIVNRRLARHYFGSADPRGRRFTLEDQTRVYEIVGVAEDAKYSSLHEEAPATIYLHAFQEARGNVSEFALRTDVPPMTVAAEVSRAVADVAPRLKIAKLRTLSDQVDASIVSERLMAKLSGVLAVLGAMLAAIGLYGLLAYSVALRRTEIGIRMVLGATRGGVTRMVLRSAIGLLLLGIALAIPLAFWSQQIAGTLIENLTADRTSPVLWAAMSLTVVAIVAAAIPAHRASRVEPAEALRDT